MARLFALYALGIPSSLYSAGLSQDRDHTADPRHIGLDAMTPSRSKSWISSQDRPKRLSRISRLCCPKTGAGFRIRGQPGSAATPVQ
jgi:hypothetical protein